ncbi:hypothetical protein [Streptomyces sp. NPDC005732]|uniref:hypothetical protein n=1 Tax=Streptomyces sp. NPDC005732 TaxID=3157057 RepID=UPI0033CD2AA4
MTDTYGQAKALARARRTELLDAMRRSPDQWTTGRVTAFYRANGWGCNRNVARQDLRFLTERGQLREHGPENDRAYSPILTDGWQAPTSSGRKHRR